MDKNLAVSAGDMDLDPSLERSHMLSSNETCAPQLLSLCSRAHKGQLLKPVLLEPTLSNKSSHCSVKPVQHNQRGAPLAATREKPVQQRPKIIKSKKKNRFLKKKRKTSSRSTGMLSRDRRALYLQF